MQMVLMPLMFLSGALYPLAGLPGWLNIAVKVNPITYAVHPLREAVFTHIHANAAAVTRLNPPITWFGWEVPIPVQLALVVFAGFALLWVAILEFDRAD
jgi:ABC-2 type transport system permease protein